jgi:type III secretion system low calcium response chaperone LcrH/SycD
MAKGEIDLAGAEAMVHAIAFEGYTFKDFADISDDEMEALYTHAYGLMSQGQYADAEKLLAWMCGLDQYQTKYFIALGVCRQQQHDYVRATEAYAAAGVLDVDNPVPALRAAECFLALGNLEAAESGVMAALHWSGAKAEHEAVRQRARILKEALERRRGRTS